MPMNKPLAFAVELSENSKTGPVSATYSAQSSCPSCCPLLDGQGCYAETGMVGIYSARLNKNAGGRTARIDPRKIAREEARAIDGLTGERPLRLHVVGDARTNGAAKILARAAGDYIRRGWRSLLLSKRMEGRPKPLDSHWTRVWTYTHAWRTVSRKSWLGPWGNNVVSVLASCETINQTRKAMELGYAAALVVDSHPVDGKAWSAPGGKVTVIPCPAQTKPGEVTCVSCRLCWKDDWLRETRRVIAFEAHGSGKNKVRERLVQLGNKTN